MGIVKNKSVFILVIVILLLAAIPSVYFYTQYAAMKKQVAAAKPAPEDPKVLIARVAKHILLPTGEDPTVMTVTDKEKLSGQLFFANAKNGDKVLVYEKAKKAFLYDPDGDIVIEVGPILLTASGSGSLSSAAPSPATGSPPRTQAPQASYTFELLNATLISGLTKTYEAKLLAAVPTARVVARGNAKGDYPTSLIVDVSGLHKTETTVFAKNLGLTVSPLPAGESTTSADFLIILAPDQK